MKIWNSAPGKENNIKEFNMFAAIDSVMENPPGRESKRFAALEETKLLKGIFPR